MPLTIETTLEPRGPACAIVLDDAQVAELGGGKRAAVQVTIGAHTARLRLAVMGGQNLIGLSKAARAEFGVEIGERVHAVIDLDEQPREVVVPDELAAVLATDAAAAAAFEKLSFTARKEYAVWVGGAKKAETRDRRAEQALQQLRAGE